MKIMTLTLNPAFDVHYEVSDLQLYQENYGAYLSRQSAGKGVNISRALNEYGIENQAIVVLGDKNAEEYKRGLESDGISFKEIAVEGRIRENITIHSPKTPETRISFEGFAAEDTLLQKVTETLALEEDCVVTFTGRIPKGLSKETVKSFLKELQKRGARLVIDSNSFDKEDLMEVKPMLIKPNQQEIATLTGIAPTPEQGMEIAEEFHRQGIEHVLISFGEQGIVYAGMAGRFQITVPQVSVLSTIGAGDSTIAGFLAGLEQGLEMKDVLRLAAAFGTAACMAEGTNPPNKETIDELFEKTECK